MSRFYTDLPLSMGRTIALPEPVFHHWVRVLRATIGDTAIVFNGQGGEYTATLVDIGKHQASVLLSDFNAKDRTPASQVTLGLVMSKGDRMDYAIQKATELGVHAIQLLTSERCELRLKYERDQKKLQHWQQVAIAACEQCGMNRIPQVLPPVTLREWVDQPAADSLRLVLAPTLSTRILPTPLPATIQLLIGPEGGLSEAEIVTAQQAGFLGWQLGERILRTETAPVVALSLLWYHQQTG